MKIMITIRNCVDQRNREQGNDVQNDTIQKDDRQWEIANRDFNIQVDNKQRIVTTIRVLKENMPDYMRGLLEPVVVRSYRSKRRININENYEHEMVYSGDILMLNNE